MNIGEAIKQSHFADSYQKAIINLLFTGNWLRDKQATLFKEHDILPQHYNVLRIIKGHSPKPISPGEIKEVMLDKGNDITRLIDKLVQKGLVKRALCEENRRKMDVTITNKGLLLIKYLDAPLNELLNEIKKRLTQPEAEELSSLLDKMRD